MQWRATMFLLTVPCPVGPGDPLLGTTEQEVLEWVELAFGKAAVQMICSLELHESGKTHLHMFLKFDSQVQRSGTFYFKGCVVNNAKKKKGKTSAGLCVQYVCKDGYLFEIGIGDPAVFVQCLLAKKASKSALLVKGIQGGVSDKQLTVDHPEAMFQLGHKVGPFRLRHEVASFKVPEHCGLVVLDLGTLPGWLPQLDPPELQITNWVETVRRVLLFKDTIHCYIFSKTKSAGKSTFALMVDKLANPPNGRGIYCFGDKGWQDQMSPDVQVLICDGVSGPAVPFKLVEDLATMAVILPKRNGGGVQVGPLPILMTANKDYEELGYVDGARMPMDMEVWDARFVKVRLQRPLHKFNKWFSTVQGLDIQEPCNATPVRNLQALKKAKVQQPQFGGF